MKKEVFKMIQVDRECHEMAKTVARDRGMLLREYIKRIVKKDFENLDKEVKV